MDWNGQCFLELDPRPSPTLKVEVSVMHQAHESFGRYARHRDIKSNVATSSFADSGAQTCSSGPEILDLLNCPDEYIIPTSHRICGITNSALDIRGVLLLHIRVGKEETRQVVYIANNSK